MKYKVSNELLKIREYGRNIQMMVDYAKKLDDDAERNALVHEIVRIMSNIHPTIKDQPDYQQKLWDHLYHLADYELDVISDFKIPDHDVIHSRPPERMSYYEGRPRFRQYGKNVDGLVEAACKMDDPKERKALVNVIANFMRLQLRNHEKDSNAEATIIEHLKTLSQGKLIVSPNDIYFYKTPPTKQPQKNTGQQGYAKKSKNKNRRKRQH